MGWCIWSLFLEIPHGVVHLEFVFEIPHGVVHLEFVFGDL